MKKAIVMLAVLVMGSAALDAQMNVPATIGIVDAQLPPEQRITLQNNVNRVVIAVQVPVMGHWDFSGGATVQLNAAPGTRGQYLYTQAAFTTDPNTIPLDGSVGLDARPYGTWWFDSSPKTHSFRLNVGDTVYLVVKYYGQTPVQLAQVFGSINGILVH